MPSEKLKIVVAGDVTVDWYFWTRPPEQDQKVNWKLYEGISTSPQIGGAILLANMLRINLEEQINKDTFEILYKQFDPNKLKELDSSHILHTNVKLGLFPRREHLIDDNEDGSKNSQNNKIYRVKRNLGYTTPSGKELCPDPLDIISDKDSVKSIADNAEFVIIHDAGNGFRDSRREPKNESPKGEIWSEKWPETLKQNKESVIIYNMYPPLFEGDLWNYIINHKKNLILILNADDLRTLGANISRSLSWEKTALDFLWEMKHNQKLKQIKDLPNVIVRFNNEGAIHYNGQYKRSRLYFDPSFAEGGSWNGEKLGTMRGISLLFVSIISSELISNYMNKNSDIPQERNVDAFFQKETEEVLINGIKKGLIDSQKFIKNGHGRNEKENPVFFYKICKNLFEDSKNDKKYQDYVSCIEVPNDDNTKPNLNSWSILGNKRKGMKSENLAINIVKKGPSVIKEIPKGCFGKLTTIDRNEIESFRSIKRLMKGYINSENSKPLSIAAFGYPGSGKSFGITEVAKSIDKNKVFKVDFNVSQFASIKDLTNAFYRIRDISLEGKIPLVFFDEFDCKFERQPLGWLKYFLVPMQDGKFLDNGNLHPIGKSIFVFAGGVYKNYEEFCANLGIGSNPQGSNPQISHYQNENSTSSNMPEKCPDFVSRLRGYVNILGPNKINDDDEAYIIRRAIQLRSLIEEKIPHIIKTSNNNLNGKRNVAEVDIDEDILRALIKIDSYIHGVRSMEAVIDMSIISGENSWQKSSLPSKDQLELHVDGSKFYELLNANPDD